MAAVKAATTYMGVAVGNPRPPILPLSTEKRRGLSNWSMPRTLPWRDYQDKVVSRLNTLAHAAPGNNSAGDDLGRLDQALYIHVFVAAVDAAAASADIGAGHAKIWRETGIHAAGSGHACQSV